MKQTPWNPPSIPSPPGILVLGLLLSCLCLDAEGPARPDNLPEVDTIIQRVRKASQQPPSDPGHRFLRRVLVRDLKAGGEVQKERSKTYRAFTDGRSQILLTVDGRQATDEEVAREAQKNRRRKRRFLNDESGDHQRSSQSKESLMDRNVGLFHDKFLPQLVGLDEVKGRSAYRIRLIPDREHRLESGTMDRLFNHLSLQVWIDSEDYQVAKLEAELTQSVPILGGLAGAFRGMRVSVTQRRLGPNEWADELLNAFFDARLLWKAFHFGVTSQSEDFRPAERSPAAD